MRPRTSFALFVFLLSLIGAETWASANVLPAGTALHIRTTQPIFASTARPGTRVGGVVDSRVSVGRRMVIPSGSPATLVVVSRSPNHQRVDLSVRTIRVGRTRYALSTNDVRVRTRPGRGFVGTTGGQARVVSGRSVPARTRLRFQ